MKLKERLKTIKKVCEEWAFDDGKNYIISAWELADNLNNQWFAPLFFRKGDIRKYNISIIAHSDNRFAVKNFELHYLVRRVINTMKKVKGVKIKPCGLNTWFIIPKNLLKV